MIKRLCTLILSLGKSEDTSEERRNGFIENNLKKDLPKLEEKDILRYISLFWECAKYNGEEAAINEHKKKVQRYKEQADQIKLVYPWYDRFHDAVEEGLKRDILVAKFTLSDGDEKEDEIYKLTKRAERSHREYANQASREINRLKLEQKIVFENFPIFICTTKQP